jgi:hypothetical protein
MHPLKWLGVEGLAVDAVACARSLNLLARCTEWCSPADTAVAKRTCDRSFTTPAPHTRAIFRGSSSQPLLRRLLCRARSRRATPPQHCRQCMRRLGSRPCDNPTPVRSTLLSLVTVRLVSALPPRTVDYLPRLIPTLLQHLCAANAAVTARCSSSTRRSRRKPAWQPT